MHDLGSRGPVRLVKESTVATVQMPQKDCIDRKSKTQGARSSPCFRFLYPPIAVESRYHTLLFSRPASTIKPLMYAYDPVASR